MLRRLLAAWPRVGAPLPDPQRGRDAQARDQLLLLGGLALLLSRCPPALARSRFPHALAVHGQLAAVRGARAAALDARQLSELAHEIAEHVDAHTRAAALRCLHAAARSGASRPPATWHGAAA